MASSSSSPALKYLGLCRTIKKLGAKEAQSLYGRAKNKAGALKDHIEVAERIAEDYVSPVSKVAGEVATKVLTYADEMTDRGITCVENKLPDVLKPVVEVGKNVPAVLNDVLELGPATTYKNLLVKVPAEFPSVAINFITWLLKQPHGEKLLLGLLLLLLKFANVYTSALNFLEKLELPYQNWLPPAPVKTLELMINVMQKQQFFDKDGILVKALICVINGDLAGLAALAANMGLDIAGELQLQNIFSNFADYTSNVGSDSTSASLVGNNGSPETLASNVSRVGILVLVWLLCLFFTVFIEYAVVISVCSRV